MIKMNFGIKELFGSFETGAKSVSFEGLKNVIKEQQKANKEKELLEKIQRIAEIGIYVGIPEDNSPRKKGQINNAALLYLHTNGSELRNLPARPLIEPALKANDAKIAEDLAEISRRLLAGNYQSALSMMKITGQDAVNMIMDWFEDPANGWEPNQPSTVKAKIRKRFKSKKKRKEAYEEYEAGVPVDQVLVDTGQMRKAITYVLGDKVKGK